MNVELDKLIINSLNEYQKDKIQLPNDINERASVFRIGHYLANIIENDGYFESYHVDVEYNRDLDSVKTLDKIMIIPDLIIHERGTNSNNLVAIEFKKNKDSKKDKEKLEKLINSNYGYNYKNVYFIIINKGIIQKYINGEWKEINIKEGDNQ